MYVKHCGVKKMLLDFGAFRLFQSGELAQLHKCHATQWVGTGV